VAVKSHLTEHDAALLRQRISRWYSARESYVWELPQLVGPYNSYVVQSDPDSKREAAKIRRRMLRIEKNNTVASALLEMLITELEKS
jgi:spermidine synthase